MITVPDTLLQKASRGTPHDRPPVWMMRQAGRYMPEYRALKKRMGGFWGLCTNADAICEATVFAQQTLQCDAAIIFSDITVPAWGMGLNLEFAPGPKFTNPIRSLADVSGLTSYDPHDKTKFLVEGIKKTRNQLPDDISLIGFVGAPFTVAGYMIEGYPSRNWVELKRVVYNNATWLRDLLQQMTDQLIVHARAQVQAGCDVIQIFDTTAGELAATELHELAFAYAKKLIDGMQDLGVPVTYFARHVSSHLVSLKALGADVIGVDWSIPLSRARSILGPEVSLMGNLDPTVLFCSRNEVERRVQAILKEMAGDNRFIFNLGHGILPETPVENAKHLVHVVHG